MMLCTHYSACNCLLRSEGCWEGNEAQAADKVCVQASKNLFYVPRFRGHTIIHPVNAKYGRVKIHAYPMTSGSGIRASKLMESICRLAGLRNIGIKVPTHKLSLQTCSCLAELYTLSADVLTLFRALHTSTL